MSTLNVTKRGDKWQYRFKLLPSMASVSVFLNPALKRKKEAVEAGTGAGRIQRKRSDFQSFQHFRCGLSGKLD